MTSELAGIQEHAGLACECSPRWAGRSGPDLLPPNRLQGALPPSDLPRDLKTPRERGQRRRRSRVCLPEGVWVTLQCAVRFQQMQIKAEINLKLNNKISPNEEAKPGRKLPALHHPPRGEKPRLVCLFREQSRHPWGLARGPAGEPGMRAPCSHMGRSLRKVLSRRTGWRRGHRCPFNSYCVPLAFHKEV